MKRSSLALVAAPAILAVLVGCATTPQRGGPDRLKTQFARADTNNDGKVTREEFRILNIEQAFELFDADGNDGITINEFIAAGGSEAAFHQIDRNGTGMLTIEELIASRVSMDAMTAAFYEADVDNDGSVTLAEALAYREKVRAVTR